MFLMETFIYEKTASCLPTGAVFFRAIIIAIDMLNAVWECLFGSFLSKALWTSFHV